MRKVTLGIATFAVVGCAFVVGCGSAANIGDDDGGPNGGADTGLLPDGAPINPTCTPTVSFDPKAGQVVELRSATPLSLPILLADSGTTKGQHPLKVVLLKDGAEVKTLVDAPSAEALAKDGKSLGALPVDIVATSAATQIPGKYTVRATLSCPSDVKNAAPATQETPLWILRLGVKTIDVQKGDGEKVPLMYHAVDHAFKNYYPIPDTMPVVSLTAKDGEPELDDPTGVPRDLPAIWTALDTPQVDASGAVLQNGTTFPVSLKIGTSPDVVLTMGKTTSGATPTTPPISAGLDLPGVPAVRVVLDGDTRSTSDGTIGTDGKSTFRLATSPVPAIQQVDLALKWHFEAKGVGGDWVAVPGATQSATFRIYGVLGNTQGTVSPQLPWVALVDAATKKIAGKATDENGARSALVEYVFKELSLTYDRRSGASAYTGSTSSDGFTNDSFALSSFLKRSYGNVVNCSDCASILSTYANMIGAELHYCIIGWNFSLNPIEGIGATTFGSPFDSGRFEFSYHAVTSPDSSAHIFDATLAVDGDSDPTTAPYTEELVQNLTGDDYLHRLSPGTPSWQYVDQKTSVK